MYREAGSQPRAGIAAWQQAEPAGSRDQRRLMDKGAGRRLNAINAPGLRAYVIGQTPRPDLTADLEGRLQGMPVEVVGALDGLSADAVEQCDGCDYPLETRLRDGSRIVVGAGYVEARLQRVLDAFQGEAFAHLILCAGPFPSLALPEPSHGRGGLLVRPFDTGVRFLRERGHRRLAVLVPFHAQVIPAARKWQAAGFGPCRVRALTEKPSGTVLAPWIASWASAPDADAVVFDYVGFPADLLDGVAAGTGLPVFDLGHLTLDRLADTLHRS